MPSCANPLAVAAAKVIKGFSTLVQAALDEYVSKSELQGQRIEQALAASVMLDVSGLMTMRCQSWLNTPKMLAGQTGLFPEGQNGIHTTGICDIRRGCLAISALR